VYVNAYSSVFCTVVKSSEIYELKHYTGLLCKLDIGANLQRILQSFLRVFYVSNLEFLKFFLAVS